VARNVAWGIDIGESAIKAVRLRKTGDSVVIQDYRTIPCETRPEESHGGDKDYRVRTAIETLAREVKLKGNVVAVSIAGHDVFPRFIPLPPVEKKRVPEIVRYEARTQMPFPIEEVVWDYQPVTGYDVPGEEVEVALFAIKKATVYGFLDNLRMAGLVPDLLEISPLALYNFLIYDREVDTGTVVIDVGAGNTDLVIIDGERFWTRNVSISGNDITRALQEKYQISFEEAESLKRKAAAAKPKQAEKLFGDMRPILDDLLGEIQRSIGYYKAQTRNVRIEQVVLLGNAFKLSGLVDYFRRSLDYEVSVLGDLRRLHVVGEGEDEKFAAELPNYAVAIGLALQGLGLARINIDMMPRDLVRERVLRQKVPYAAVVAALLAVPPVWGYVEASKQLGTRQAQIKEIEPQIATLQKTEKKLTDAQKLGPVETNLNQLAALGKDRLEWLSFFDGLNKAMNELPRRDEFLLEAVRQVDDEELADSARRAGKAAPATPAPGAPHELTIELKFLKGDQFLADDLRRLRELLEKQPLVRSVTGRGQESARSRTVAGPRGRTGEPAGRAYVYTFWVVCSSQGPAPPPATK